MYKLSILIFLLYAMLGLEPKAAAAAPTECVNIYYDRGREDYWMGKTYATLLQNLLGHFPEFQQIVAPIEIYRKGEIEKCRATIYLASYFENAIPADFFSDFQKTKKQVAWLGYSIWKPESKFEEIFGYQYVGLTKLDLDRKDAEGLPGFFRNIDYKGETFVKFAEWNKEDPTKLLAPFEQVKLLRTKDGKAQLLASARHSVTNETIPYALRADNHFYIADIPFSYMHEADRYMVFADLLFDILAVPPKRSERLALVRVEDVHPLVPLADMFAISKTLRDASVPLNYSLIPIYFDPLHFYEAPGIEEYVPMARQPDFMQFLHEQPSQDSTYIWHGVTHQYRRQRNPHNGVSGDDFEFWDAIGNCPIAEDSSSWVLNRLNDGLQTIIDAGMSAPNIWLTPHYQASPLDYLIFARVFPWNVGRVIYFDFQVEGLPTPREEQSLWLKSAEEHDNQLRVSAFQNMRVTLTSSRWAGQMFPYEIFGDVYGQRLIPENLGNSQPFISEHVVRTRTVSQMIADAKRNLVIRDAWASFFYHPQLLQTYNEGGRGSYPGDPAELKLLITEIQKLGYRFINLKEFTSKNLKKIRPEPIYLETK